MKTINKSEGFTLMELLLVIVIIGIMAGIGGGYYLTSLKRGNDGKRAADLNNLRNALEMYYSDNKAYPTTGGSYETISNSLETPLASGTDRYIKILPEDPGEEDYLYSSDGSCYCLSAKMQISADYRFPLASCSCPSDHSGSCYLVTCP